MRYLLIKDQDGRQYFAANPMLTDFNGRYKDIVARADVMTLRQNMLAYEQSSEVRDMWVRRKPWIVCANAIIGHGGNAVFVERPAEVCRIVGIDEWRVTEGPNTRVWRKADGLELPRRDGYYVPVPAGGGTSKLMLGHPDTGMPFRAVRNREKAAELLVPYLQQIWDIDEEKAMRLASREVSRFIYDGHGNGAKPVILSCYDKTSYGLRAIDVVRSFDGISPTTGARRFKPAVLKEGERPFAEATRPYAQTAYMFRS